MRKIPFTVSITSVQRDRLERATAILSAQRGESVRLAVAMREWALEAADRVIEDAERVA